MDPQFSEEQLDTQQDFDGWVEPPEFAPPPPAGKYRVFLNEIREEKEEFIDSVGKRYLAVVDLKIVGGEYDGRAINFQRFSNRESLRKATKTRSSQLLDLIKSAGVQQAPKSNADFHRVLHSLKDAGAGRAFNIQIDWRGFCGKCYTKELQKLTGRMDEKEAKQFATNENKAEASKAATKAKNFRGFPEKDGVKIDQFICNDCRDTVRATVNVVRFLAPSA